MTFGAALARRSLLITIVVLVATSIPCALLFRALVVDYPMPGKSESALLHNVVLFEHGRTLGHLPEPAMELLSGMLVRLYSRETNEALELDGHLLNPTLTPFGWRLAARSLGPSLNQFRSRVSVTVVDRATTLTQVARESLANIHLPLHQISTTETVEFALVRLQYRHPPLVDDLLSDAFYSCVYEPPFWRVLFVCADAPLGYPGTVFFSDAAMRRKLLGWD